MEFRVEWVVCNESTNGVGTKRFINVRMLDEVYHHIGIILGKRFECVLTRVLVIDVENEKIVRLDVVFENGVIELVTKDGVKFE